MPLTIDGYEGLTPLGSGGYGEVFRARSERYGEVAIKVLRPDADPEDRERFKDEARVLQRLSSLSIPTFHEILELPRGPALVMEYVPGRSLHAALTDLEELPERLDLLRRVLPGILDALMAMHEMGVVHRDLKPENIQVRPDTGEGVLLDLGIAKSAETQVRTATGMISGTPGYLAPEQLLGDRTAATSPSVDLYQAALVIVRALDGSFRTDEAADPQAAFQRATGKLDPLERLATAREALPDGLLSSLVSCLNVEPHRRLATSEGLRELRRTLLAPPAIERAYSSAASAAPCGSSSEQDAGRRQPSAPMAHARVSDTSMPSIELEMTKPKARSSSASTTRLNIRSNRGLILLGCTLVALVLVDTLFWTEWGSPPRVVTQLTPGRISLTSHREGLSLQVSCSENESCAAILSRGLQSIRVQGRPTVFVPLGPFLRSNQPLVLRVESSETQSIEEGRVDLPPLLEARLEELIEGLPPLDPHWAKDLLLFHEQDAGRFSGFAPDAQAWMESYPRDVGNLVEWAHVIEQSALQESLERLFPYRAMELLAPHGSDLRARGLAGIALGRHLRVSREMSVHAGGGSGPEYWTQVHKIMLRLGWEAQLKRAAGRDSANPERFSFPENGEFSFSFESIPAGRIVAAELGANVGEGKGWCALRARFPNGNRVLIPLPFERADWVFVRIPPPLLEGALTGEAKNRTLEVSLAFVTSGGWESAPDVTVREVSLSLLAESVEDQRHRVRKGGA